MGRWEGWFSFHYTEKKDWEGMKEEGIMTSNGVVGEGEELGRSRSLLGFLKSRKELRRLCEEV